MSVYDSLQKLFASNILIIFYLVHGKHFSLLIKHNLSVTFGIFLVSFVIFFLLLFFVLL